MSPFSHLAPPRARRTAITLVELMFAAAIGTILAAVVYRIVTQAQRTTFTSLRRVSLQVDARNLVLNLTRDVHETYVFLPPEGDGTVLRLAVFDETDLAEPEGRYALNQPLETAPGALLSYPMVPRGGDTPGATLAVKEVRYTVIRDAPEAPAKVRRLERPAVLKANVVDGSWDALTLTGGDTFTERLLADRVQAFDVRHLGYGPEGELRIAEDPTTAACVALQLEAWFETASNVPEARVALATKVWSERALRDRLHRGWSSSIDTDLTY